jgi:hypothetical protein
VGSAVGCLRWCLVPDVRTHKAMKLTKRSPGALRGRSAGSCAVHF